MAKFVSTYPGKLILPKGDEISPGAEVEISAEDVKNVAVSEWIKDGWLTEAKTEKK